MESRTLLEVGSPGSIFINVVKAFSEGGTLVDGRHLSQSALEMPHYFWLIKHHGDHVKLDEFKIEHRCLD